MFLPLVALGEYWIHKDVGLVSLEDDNRLLAELYYIDEEGGYYTGNYQISGDTLILISDRIEVTSIEPLLINQAQVFRFFFLIESSNISLLKLERYRNDSWAECNVKDTYDNIKLKTMSAEESSTADGIDWAEFYFRKNIFSHKSTWKCKKSNTTIEIYHPYICKYTNHNKNEIRYGSIEINIEKTKKASLYIYFDDIQHDEIEDFQSTNLNLKDVKVELLVLEIQMQINDSIEIQKARIVPLILGDENDYSQIKIIEETIDLAGDIYERAF